MDPRDDTHLTDTTPDSRQWWLLRAWSGRRKWLVLAGLIAATLLLPQLVALLALVILVTAIVAVARGNRTWLRIPTRKLAFAMAAAALVVMFVASSVSATRANLSADDAVTASLPKVAEQEEQKPSPKPTVSRTSTPRPTPERTVKEESVTEVIAFESSTVDDGSLPAGQTAVVTQGVEGQKTLTYKVTYEGNKEVSRELVAEVVTVAPVTQVTANGTYVAPPPPPPPPPAASTGGCDPNYADACVPRSSDVDCAWGSGNGPAYFDGVARVVGSDIYGLDRDGDGYACERD